MRFHPFLAGAVALTEDLRRDSSRRDASAHACESDSGRGDPPYASGKIVEIAVRNVIHGRDVKNADALANPEALDQFRNLPELRAD